MIHVLGQADLVLTQEYLEQTIMPALKERVDKNGSQDLQMFIKTHKVPLNFMLEQTNLSPELDLKSDTSNYRLENTCLISKNYEELESKKIEDVLRGM